MRLKSLRLQNFRSFKDSTIVFPATGLVLIRGRDTATGESSGSGKTSILHGLAYALEILPAAFSGKSLQSWSTEEPLQVALTLEHEGKDIVLYRGKKTMIDFGDRQVSGAKSYAEALRSLFGIDSDLLGALVYRPQKKPGLFLNMGPSEKVEFLSGLLGLKGIEEQVELSKEAIKRLSIEKEILAAVEVSAQSRFNLAASEDPGPFTAVDLTELQVLKKTCTKALVESDENLSRVKSEISALEQVQKSAKADAVAEKNAQLTQARLFLQKLKEKDTQAERDINQIRSAMMSNDLAAANQALRDVSRLLEGLPALEKELRLLENGLCPTCMRKWDDTMARIEFLRDDITALKNRNEEIPALQENVRTITARIDSLKFTPSPEIEQLQGIERRLIGEKATLEATEETFEYKELKKQETQIKNTNLIAAVDLEKALSAIAVTEERQRSYLKNVQRIEATKKEYETQLSVAKQKKESLETNLAAEKDFEALMGRSGFLGLIVEDVLSELATETNTRLKHLANISQVTMGFTTETEKGRRQVNTWVEVRGYRSNIETGLSGGMASSLEQVVDLSLMDLISRRTGKMPSWLCYDEVFLGGQGPVTKEAALDILKQISQERLVLVIEHDAAIQEICTSIINVEFNDGTSTITS